MKKLLFLLLFIPLFSFSQSLVALEVETLQRGEKGDYTSLGTWYNTVNILIDEHLRWIDIDDMFLYLKPIEKWDKDDCIFVPFLDMTGVVVFCEGTISLLTEDNAIIYSDIYKK